MKFGIATGKLTRYSCAVWQAYVLYAGGKGIETPSANKYIISGHKHAYMHESQAAHAGLV
jgi:hypothetical protein